MHRPARGPALPAVEAEHLFDSDSFAVTAATGGYSFDVVARSVFAGANAGPGFNSSPQTEFWTGGPWPNTHLVADAEGPPGCSGGGCTFFATAAIYGISGFDAVPESVNASFGGTLPAGHAGGAIAAIDYVLVLDPGASATVELIGGYGLISLDKAPGDQGTAFGGLSLFDPYIDGDAPGGVNNAYARQELALNASTPGPLPLLWEDGLSYTFENTGSDTAFYDLRLQTQAFLFVAAPVPEPETYAMLLAGLGLLGWRVRARQR